jgi:hypothetical protein
MKSSVDFQALEPELSQIADLFHAGDSRHSTGHLVDANKDIADWLARWVLSLCHIDPFHLIVSGTGFLFSVPVVFVAASSVFACLRDIPNFFIGTNFAEFVSPRLA